MRIFLAGASGAIGRRLTPLLHKAGHDVTGMTRSAGTARELEAAGIRPAVVDVFDAEALKRAVVAARPDVVWVGAKSLNSAAWASSLKLAMKPGTNRSRKKGPCLAASASKFALMKSQASSGCSPATPTVSRALRRAGPVLSP